ncbi:MAG: RNA 2',3'-cyclic phosphodiesterase [Nanoarchaeota archaeon]|nr:RNA 2',3'-cyclic phosphodiesterase [Nanoarchaeota archaeon]
MRLFLAFDFSNPIFIQLHRLLKTEAAALSFTHSYHLTLKFFPDADPDKIISKLQGISYPKMIFSTSRIGVFPEKGPVKVIWLGIEESQPLLLLQREIEARLGKNDLDFHPHITLARVSHVFDTRVLWTGLSNILVEKTRLEPGPLTLFRSELLPGGPAYSPISYFN